MDGMRPIDHVDQSPTKDIGFWFTPPGWRSWILPCIFAVLIVINAFMAHGWGAHLIGGVLTIFVVLAVNEVLKRTLRR